MPEPVEYRVLRVGDRDVMAVRGPMPRTWAFASGNPIYIFDNSGKLIDHTIDSGDDSGLHSRWPGVYGGKRFDRAEAEAWVAVLP